MSHWLETYAPAHWETPIEAFKASGLGYRLGGVFGWVQGLGIKGLGFRGFRE